MLDDIMIFIKVVEQNSLSKAAKILNIQTSTVSKHLAELEYKLGKALFTRDTRNINITEYGKFIYDRFKHMPAYLNDTINTIPKNSKLGKYSDEGELNLCLGSVISYELICPQLDEFVKEYSNIRLNINFSPNITKWPGGNVDIVLASTYIADDNLQNRFLRSEYAHLYCRTEYAIKYGIPQKPEELVNHKLLGVLNLDSKPLDYMLLKNIKTGNEFLVDLSKTLIRINNSLYTKKIGIHSDYIFCSWDFVCAPDVKNGNLVAVLPEWVAVKIDFHIVTKKSISKAEQLFIDFMYNCISQAYNKIQG